MSLENEHIRNEFETFSGRFGPAAIVPATVKGINDDDTISIELSDGSLIDDARLKSVVKDGNKVLLIPAVDSCVLVGKIDNSDEYVVLVVDEITEVQYVVGGVKMVMDATGFLFKKDSDTLKQALVLIVEALQPTVVIYGNNPIYTKLSQALVKINNLLK